MKLALLVTCLSISNSLEITEYLKLNQDIEGTDCSLTQVKNLSMVACPTKFFASPTNAEVLQTVKSPGRSLINSEDVISYVSEKNKIFYYDGLTSHLLGLAWINTATDQVNDVSFNDQWIVTGLQSGYIQVYQQGVYSNNETKTLPEKPYFKQFGQYSLYRTSLERGLIFIKDQQRGKMHLYNFDPVNGTLSVNKTVSSTDGYYTDAVIGDNYIVAGCKACLTNKGKVIILDMNLTIIKQMSGGLQDQLGFSVALIETERITRAFASSKKGVLMHEARRVNGTEIYRDFQLLETGISSQTYLGIIQADDEAKILIKPVLTSNISSLLTCGYNMLYTESKCEYCPENQYSIGIQNSTCSSCTDDNITYPFLETVNQYQCNLDAGIKPVEPEPNNTNPEPPVIIPPVPEEDGFPIGAIIGIAAGGVVVIGIIIFILCKFVCKRKKNPESKPDETQEAREQTTAKKQNEEIDPPEIADDLEKSSEVKQKNDPEPTPVMEEQTSVHNNPPQEADPNEVKIDVDDHFDTQEMEVPSGDEGAGKPFSNK